MQSYPKPIHSPTPIPTQEGLIQVVRPFYHLAPPIPGEEDYRLAERAVRTYCIGGDHKAFDLLQLGRRTLVRLFNLETFENDPPEVWNIAERIRSRSLSGKGAA